MKLKEIITRALKTFWEAALGYAAVNAGAVALNIGDADLLRHTVLCLIASALAAGFSAVWNGILAPRFALHGNASGASASASGSASSEAIYSEEGSTHDAAADDDIKIYDK